MSIAGLAVLVAAADTQAISSSKALRKVKYVPYTGEQRDWPRSEVRVAPVEVAKGGTALYDKLPDRPYEVLGTVSAEGAHFSKHASQAAAAVGADAILIVNDKAFQDAGILAEPRLLKGAEVPDPNARKIGRLERPDLLKADAQPTKRVHLIEGILVRWKSR